MRDMSGTLCLAHVKAVIFMRTDQHDAADLHGSPTPRQSL